MNNSLLVAIVWLALWAHIAAGVATRRHIGSLPWLPLVNLIAGIGVLAYWIPRWYSYISKGITWYASDQLVPLYALVVCITAGIAVSQRSGDGVFTWLVFGVDTLVLIGAALFFTFFRMNRLM